MVTASPSQPGHRWRCVSCGKSLSNAQAIFYLHHVYCIDSLLNLLGQHDVDGETRVDVSVDYLQRLREGVV